MASTEQPKQPKEPQENFNKLATWIYETQKSKDKGKLKIVENDMHELIFKRPFIFFSPRFYTKKFNVTLLEFLKDRLPCIILGNNEEITQINDTLNDISLAQSLISNNIVPIYIDANNIDNIENTITKLFSQIKLKKKSLTINMFIAKVSAGLSFIVSNVTSYQQAKKVIVKISALITPQQYLYSIRFIIPMIFDPNQEMKDDFMRYILHTTIPSQYDKQLQWFNQIQDDLKLNIIDLYTKVSNVKSIVLVAPKLTTEKILNHFCGEILQELQYMFQIDLLGIIDATYIKNQIATNEIQIFGIPDTRKFEDFKTASMLLFITNLHDCKFEQTKNSTNLFDVFLSKKNIKLLIATIDAKNTKNIQLLLTKDADSVQRIFFALKRPKQDNAQVEEKVNDDGTSNTLQPFISEQKTIQIQKIQNEEIPKEKQSIPETSFMEHQSILLSTPIKTRKKSETQTPWLSTVRKAQFYEPTTPQISNISNIQASNQSIIFNVSDINLPPLDQSTLYDIFEPSFLDESLLDEDDDLDIWKKENVKPPPQLTIIGSKKHKLPKSQQKQQVKSKQSSAATNLPPLQETDENIAPKTESNVEQQRKKSTDSTSSQTLELVPPPATKPTPTTTLDIHHRTSQPTSSQTLAIARQLTKNLSTPTSEISRDKAWPHFALIIPSTVNILFLILFANDLHAKRTEESRNSALLLIISATITIVVNMVVAIKTNGTSMQTAAIGVIIHLIFVLFYVNWFLNIFESNKLINVDYINLIYGTFNVLFIVMHMYQSNQK